ncbi:MAG: ATP-binding protein, partial [Devosia sp.]|nr:ATP-binding protein [Devosia sp.]
MCRGRKRGLAGVIATQRLAKLAKNVAAEASNFLMGRTFLDIDMARAADLLGMEKRQAEQFRDLARGHFIALGPAISRRPLPVVIGTVETSARSTSPKLTPFEAPVDAAELIFTAEPELARPVVRRPAPPPPPSTNELLAQVARARPEAE